ncbi:MAG: sigma-70 family RNA polymerase sigma factor [Acidimicrobiales bacterium]
MEANLYSGDGNGRLRSTGPVGRAMAGIRSRRNVAARPAGARHALGQLSDAELVDLVRDRNRGAYAELMNRHRRLISSICARLVLDPHDAEDALQAAQLAVWERIETFRGEAKFSTWLRTVTYNACLGQLRRRWPVPVRQLPERDLDGGQELRITDAEAIRWALARLPLEFRLTLILKECLDLSVKEIAELQAVPEGTVKSRLSRARSAMFLLLSDEGESNV